MTSLTWGRLTSSRYPFAALVALAGGVSATAREIRARASDGPLASRVANAYATDYVRLGQEQAIAEFDATKHEVGRKLEELQRELDASAPDAVARRSSLESERGVFKQQLDQPVDGARPRAAFRLDAET